MISHVLPGYTYHRHLDDHLYISLMSNKTTLFTVYVILHIAKIFSDALSFHAWLCICTEPILKAVFGLSLMLEYWIPPLQKFKPASCKYFNRTANRMHGCCCQQVFVIEVSLGYVQYFIYFTYGFQFTACCIVVYRIKLIYHVSCHVWYVYIKNVSCPSLWCLNLLSHSWWFILSPCKYCSLMWTNREKYGQFHFHRQRAG